MFYHQNILTDDNFIDFMEDLVYKICGNENNEDRLDCLLNRLNKVMLNNPNLIKEIENFPINYRSFNKMGNVEKELNYYMDEITDHVQNFNVKNQNDLFIKSFRMRYLYTQTKKVIENLYITDDKKANLLQSLDSFMAEFDKKKNDLQL